MSMHKIPLTEIEESGLRAHKLDIGKPSQLSDAFRLGVKWASENTAKSEGSEPFGGLYQFGAKETVWWSYTPTYKPPECFDTEPGQVVRSIPVFTHAPDSAARIKELEAECQARREDLSDFARLTLNQVEDQKSEIQDLKEKLQVARDALKEAGIVRSALIRWRQREFPGTDQKKVIEVEFPLITQALTAIREG